MEDFLRNNWIWIALIVFFIWMHGSGMGCGGHGGHGDKEASSKPGEGGGHQH